MRSTRPDLLRRVIVTTGIPEKYVGSLDEAEICGMIRKPIELAEMQRLLERCIAPMALQGSGESPLVYR
jgi:hypothetical protein